MTKAVIFDFDGTLTELTLNFTDMRHEIEELAERFVPAASIRELGHLYILEMISEIEGRCGEGGSRFRDEALARLRRDEVEAAEGKEVYPYTRDVLTGLIGLNIRIGIMTRNCVEAVRTVFPDMDVYAEAVLTREDVAVVKPHPQHVKALLALLGVRPSDALVVGDHPTDILAGRAAGTVTAGVMTGRAETRDFEEAGADHIIKDIRGVFGVIESSGH
jgi:phosphoglycolate phosphatase